MSNGLGPQPFPPLRTPRNQIVAATAEDLLGTIDSTAVYLVDGAIDLSGESIVVPEGGMQISGLGVTISSLTSTAPIFKTAPDGYSGDLFIDALTLTSPSAFDLDNQENSGSAEFTRVNFVNCASLGELSSYRQGLYSNVALIGCDGGLTLSGTWSGGFAALTAVVVGAMTDPLFSSGDLLAIQGSMRSDFNALQLGGALFTDIGESEIIQDGGFVMENVRVPGGYDAFPNMPSSSVKARFRNCQGVRDTYPGGQYTFTSEAVTTITAANTPAKLAGTTAGNDLQWFSGAGNNELTYISTQPIEVEVKSVLTLAGGNADQVQILIRQWDDSAGEYIDLSASGAATMNQSGRAEGVALFGYASLSESDRIEIWVENLSDDSGITAKIGGIVGVIER